MASLLVGCVATGLAFSSDAFSISAQTFKEVFNYSQTEGKFGRGVNKRRKPYTFILIKTEYAR